MSPVAATAQEATAQEATTCVTQDADLPAELAGWPAKISLTAASGAPGLSQAALTPGQAYLATLASTSAVTYLAPPEKPGDPATHGGLFDLTVPTAGTYVVALGAAGWIDLLRDGASVPSAFHSHGPACSTVRKIVGFELQPGRYGVQIAGSVPAILPIMVAKRP
ncbi:MAG: homogentisate 1,2-dioxygenase [Alphaproteobacteria bacterium]|nr:homogentisate 1,2-dioxygenase [Alphaproteobacteria bacterium]